MAPFPALWDGGKNEPGSSNCLGEIVKGRRTAKDNGVIRMDDSHRTHGRAAVSFSM